MMAAPPPPTPAYTPLPNPVVVVGQQFLAGYPVDLVISKKLMTLREGQFTVADVNGNPMFIVKGSIFSIHDHRVLRDAAGTPVVSFRQKIMTMHHRWKVFRGDSSDDKDLLFSVKKSSLLQFRTKLDVFLAGNTQEEACDFHIEGAFMESGCTIYLGNSSTAIAKMHRNYNIKSVFFDKDTYTVTVYPNVDYAFVAALVVILHEINADRSGED